MAERIPQGQTIRVPLQAYLASDHVSAATGKTIAITISKNGAAYGNPSAGATNATEIASGSYYVDLSTTDTNTLGPVFVKGAVATVDTIIAIYNVVGSSISQSGTAQTGTVNTITLASAASSTNGTYDPSLVRITGGTGAGQARLILDYVGATRVAVVDRDWRVNPDNTSTYEIMAAPNLNSTNEGLAQAGGASSITLNSSGSAIDNTYNGQVVVLRTGLGQDQSRVITAYNGTTKVATVDTAWVTNPDSTSGYMVMQACRLDSTISTAVTAVKAKTDNLPAAPASTGDAMTLTAAYNAAKTAAQVSDIPTTAQNAAAVLTTQMTESYAAFHASPTLAQAAFEVRAILAESAISGTTRTSKKIDGSTTARTYTLDSSTAPTSITTAS